METTRMTKTSQFIRDMAYTNLKNCDSGIDLDLKTKSGPPLKIADENLRPMIATKPAVKGTKNKQIIPLKTNVFVFRIPTETVLHRYSVTVTTRDGTVERDLTRGANDDHRREEKKNACYEYMWMLVEEYGEIFQHPFAAAYDRRKIYYSLNKLAFSGKKSFALYNGSVMVTLEPAGQLTVGDFQSEISQDLGKRLRDQQQLLEVLSSQIIFYKEKYVQIGRSILDTTGQEEPEKDLGGGKFLASGYTKGVRLIEGTGKSPTVALQIDQKKAALYKSQNVIHTLMEMLDRKPSSLKDGLDARERRFLQEQLKGVVVSVVHSQRGRKFDIQGVSPTTALKTEIDFLDKKLGITRKVSVAVYFTEIKDLKLDFPGLPCLIEKTSRGLNYYPFEVCEICENQRVPMHKQTPEQMQNAIKKCALKPSDREEQLEFRAKDSEIRGNDFLAALGMEVMQKPIELEGRVLHQPMIEYAPSPGGSKKTYKVNLNGIWDMKGDAKWYIPGKLERGWTFLCTDERCQETTLLAFLKKYMMYAKQTGINLGGEPSKENCKTEFLDAFFKESGRKGTEFILIILNSKKDSAVKETIKNLEQRYEILTQCIRSQVLADIASPAKDPRNGRLKNSLGTLMNILAKTNMKLGGLNFKIDVGNDGLLKKWFSGRVLYLGADVNHPPPQSAEERRLGTPPKEPSVIGMVGSGAEPNIQFRYTGEHWFQDPRVETITAMKDLTKEFLRRYEKSAQTVPGLPKSVILFRDGVSEGQYRMLLEEEVPAMKKGFAEFSHGFCPKLTLVVVLKRHTLRMMNRKHNPALKATEQDIPVGTVVDHTVVHPTNWEFYLQSHRAIQGTAKCSKYCIVVDENGLTQNEVEGMAYVLAHGHQIVAKSVSLPAPVYGAHEMAERGKKLYRAENSESEASSSGCSTNDAPDWEEFSRKHRIGGTKLEERKHWA